MRNGSVPGDSLACTCDRLRKRRRIRPPALVPLGLVLFSWLGCDGGVEPVLGPAIDVDVVPAGLAISGVGATAAFGVVARDWHGDTLASPAVVWSSLNPYVANISPAGIATAVGNGQVTVAAEVDGQVGYALLTVSTPELGPIISWSAQLPDTVPLFHVWGMSPSNVFAVGSRGMVLHYDGVEWNAMTSGTSGYLEAVWGSSSSDVWAVGVRAQEWRSTIAHYDGAEWTGVTSENDAPLRGVWGTSPDDIYAVGSRGTILHQDGTGWSEMTSGTDMDLNGVWGTSSGDVFAVGDLGTILHYDGSGWLGMNSGTTWQLTSVWGTSSADVYAVGMGGTILHFDGTRWSSLSNQTTELVHTLDICGTSSSDIYVVGFGAILHYDGTVWNTVTTELDPSTDLLGVWAASSGEVYVVGSGGAVLRGTR